MCESHPKQIAAEIQVTPEMIDAGISELEAWSDSHDWREENLVTRIFLAMRNADPNYPP